MNLYVYKRVYSAISCNLLQDLPFCFSFVLDHWMFEAFLFFFPGPTMWQHVLTSNLQDLLREVDANGDGSIDFEASAGSKHPSNEL